jgi:IPT/TIG domain/Glucose / Sorbosone dehydrogenase
VNFGAKLFYVANAFFDFILTQFLFTILFDKKDNYYSSATLVAHLADPLFNGRITYDADDDGTPNGGYGIEVFAAGTRNPFGIVLHSNGNLYATDNGPNLGYGDMMTGCGPGQSIPARAEQDKINLLVKGGYYGAPNRKRALTNNDPRQCVWRSQNEPSDANFTAPILVVKSSTDGIIEFQSDHFDGQLRGNLIAAKYLGSLYRVILTPDGKGVIPQSNPAIELLGDYDPQALSLTQAPDGTIISCSVGSNMLSFHKPNELPTTAMQVKSVFPRRGGQAGGNTLTIFGVNFGASPTVTVGGGPCTVISAIATKIECTVPGSTGTVDVVVTAGGQTYTFQKGYRYVTGLPAV